MHECEMQEAKEDVGYAKSRTAALRVETGRWNSLKREERICRLCSMGEIEDEDLFC